MERSFVGFAICLVLVSCGGGGNDETAAAIERVLSRSIHTAVATGDLNADGLVDVIGISTVFEPEQTVLSIYRQIQIGQFREASNISLGRVSNMRSSFVTTFDLDQDGGLDIIVSHDGGNQVSVLMQDPQHLGVFLEQKAYVVGQRPKRIAIGDSLPDLVSNDEYSIQVYLHDPWTLGQFTPGPRIRTINRPFRIALNDLDGDGSIDIVVGTNRPEGNANLASIEVLLQDPMNPSGFRGPVEYVLLKASFLFLVDVIDLNGDDRPDVIGGFSPVPNEDSSISVLLQSDYGGGDLNPPTFYGAGSSPLEGVTSLLNADMSPDVVIADLYDGVAAYYQIPQGSGHYGRRMSIGQ
jgi:hypothetical protein